MNKYCKTSYFPAAPKRQHEPDCRDGANCNNAVFRCQVGFALYYIKHSKKIQSQEYKQGYYRQ